MNIRPHRSRYSWSGPGGPAAECGGGLRAPGSGGAAGEPHLGDQPEQAAAEGSGGRPAAGALHLPGQTELTATVVY